MSRSQGLSRQTGTGDIPANEDISMKSRLNPYVVAA
jgi:hypothetical protein